MGERMGLKDSKGIFANVMAKTEAAAPALAKSASPHLRKVSEGVKELQEKGDALDRLLRDGAYVTEIEPDEIMPSAILDRFEGAYGATAVEDILASMKERGQIVPGLVRPHGSSYQIVFGRRRLAAAKLLGIKFRAIVRELSDEEAIILQGEENTNRNDLSFIEKCAFALSLEQAGYRREVICSSLSTDKSRISDMLKIATAIPLGTIMAIGPAHEIGRRRWMEFADAWKVSENAHHKVVEVLRLKMDATDNERFSIALAALKSKFIEPAGDSVEVRANGFLLATATYTKSGARLVFNKAAPEGFVEFLTTKMEELHAEFMKSHDIKG
ncbi:MAG: plasmid partitioning protein RepB [Rhizobium sp.]|nr:plasmid partitioning protein RepB [Rhizobium sp.]